MIFISVNVWSFGKYIGRANKRFYYLKLQLQKRVNKNVTFYVRASYFNHVMLLCVLAFLVYKESKMKMIHNLEEIKCISVVQFSCSKLVSNFAIIPRKLEEAFLFLA